MNEFQPTWRQQTMTAEVVEGRVYDFIHRVEAVDRDGRMDSRGICRYHLLTPDVPFDVDADGKSVA